MLIHQLYSFFFQHFLLFHLHLITHFKWNLLFFPAYFLDSPLPVMDSLNRLNALLAKSDTEKTAYDSNVVWKCLSLIYYAPANRETNATHRSRGDEATPACCVHGETIVLRMFQETGHFLVVTWTITINFRLLAKAARTVLEMTLSWLYFIALASPSMRWWKFR